VAEFHIDADVTSVGNTFTVPDAVSSNGRLITIDDRAVAPAAVNTDPPTLPSVPQDRRRQVFEVDPGADTGAIQRAIDRAADRVGTRPVVHIPFGRYTVTRTLTIPPGDIQVVGDGYATELKWAGPDRGPMLRIAGPSKATLRELQLDGAGKADVIVAEGVESDARARFLDGVQVRAGSESNFLVDHLRNANVATDRLRPRLRSDRRVRKGARQQADGLFRRIERKRSEL